MAAQSVSAEPTDWSGEARCGDQTYKASLNFVSTDASGVAILVLKDKAGIEKTYALNLKPTPLSSAPSSLKSAQTSPSSVPEPAQVLLTDTEKRQLGKPYMDQVQAKIKQCWQQVRTPNSRMVMVHFWIDKNGKVQDLKLDDRYGQQIFDDQAVAGLHAVELAAPFDPPPPAILSDGRAEVAFTFTRNVIPRTAAKRHGFVF